MKMIEQSKTKYGFATRAVPLEEMIWTTPASGTPSAGDLVLAEVLTIGRHKTMEARSGALMYLFPGDLIVGTFGNRYATDQFEGYVPAGPVEECDLLSVGGVMGEVASQHDSMSPPTRVRVLGSVCDMLGAPLNQREFGLRAMVDDAARGGAETILVIGSSMNSGKTTTAGTIARSLSRKGFKVAAAKVTGTACSKDLRYFESCGASPVLDFTSVGYPSTYMASLEELERLHRTLLAHLKADDPDYVVIEIADGIFQRETRMMLDSERILETVDHVLFAAGDSLSVECGVRFVRELGLPLRATSGAITRSLLSVREAEEVTGVPCLGTEELMNGRLTEALGIAHVAHGQHTTFDAPQASVVGERSA
ncbi:MAG TPA: hypothetical protein VKA73_03225 [Rubrobacter sp.]|nr:hypothetical protein [Rubrobacter sp.]